MARNARQEKEFLSNTSSLLSKINALLGCPVVGHDVAELLRDGSILCKIVVNWRPSSCCKAYIEGSSHAYKCLQNINLFIRACTTELGVAREFLFDPLDLWDMRDVPRVVKGVLFALSKMENVALPKPNMGALLNCSEMEEESPPAPSPLVHDENVISKKVTRTKKVVASLPPSNEGDCLTGQELDSCVRRFLFTLYLERPELRQILDSANLRSCTTAGHYVFRGIRVKLFSPRGKNEEAEPKIFVLRASGKAQPFEKWVVQKFFQRKRENSPRKLIDDEFSSLKRMVQRQGERDPLAKLQNLI